MITLQDKKYFKLAIPGPYKESSLDVAAKCPICGDSKTKNSKRLHLYCKENKTRIKCFNGGCPIENPHTVGRFLKHYYPELYQDYRRETFRIQIKTEKIIENTTIVTKVFEDSENPTKVLNPENPQDTTKVETQNPIRKNYEASELLEFLKVLSQNITVLNEPTKKFLLQRGLNPENLQREFGKFYSGTGDFLFNGKFYRLKNTLFIPILNYKKDIVGFYARSINEKRFVNHNRLRGPFIPYNFCGVDLESEVYIFEAILDMFSFYQIYSQDSSEDSKKYKNCIALCTNNINPQILGLIKKPVFCLDNDSVGIRTMLKYINVNNSKFLIYNTECKDFNEMLLKNEKMELNFESGFKANLSLRKLIA